MKTHSRSCRHCGSPPRGRPCWWWISGEAMLHDAEADPPCISDDYADGMRAGRRRAAKWLIAMGAAGAAAGLAIFLIFIR